MLPRPVPCPDTRAKLDAEDRADRASYSERIVALSQRKRQLSRAARVAWDRLALLRESGWQRGPPPATAQLSGLLRPRRRGAALTASRAASPAGPSSESSTSSVRSDAV